MEEPLLDYSKLQISSEKLKKSTRSEEELRAYIEEKRGIQSLFLALNCNPYEGLDPDDFADVEERIRLYGKNKTEIEKEVPYFTFFLDLLKEKYAVLTVTLTLLRLGINIYWDKHHLIFDYVILAGTFIGALVMIAYVKMNTWRILVAFKQQYKTRDVRVIRKKERMAIPKDKLLVGDIVYLSEGDVCPVDGIIIRSFSISFTEGDHIAVYDDVNFEEDSDYYPLIVSGERILKGTCFILCTGVGKNTALYDKSKRKISQIKNAIHTSNTLGEVNMHSTELQQAIKSVCGWTNLLTIFCVLFVTALIMANYYLGIRQTEPTFDSTLSDALLMSILLVVVLSPVHIKAILDVAVSKCFSQMKQDNINVKSTETCEKLAKMKFICTDIKGLFSEQGVKVNDFIFSNESVGLEIDKTVPEALVGFIYECMALNFSLFVFEIDLNRFYSHYIETAILRFLRQNKIRLANYKNNPGRPRIFKATHSRFNTVKYAVVEMDDKPSKIRLYCVGLADELQGIVRNYVNKEGKLARMSRHKLNDQIARSKSNVETPVILAYKDINKETYFNSLKTREQAREHWEEAMVSELNLIAIVTLASGFRRDVTEYIKESASLGIDLKVFSTETKDSTKQYIRSGSSVSSIEEASMTLLDSRDSIRRPFMDKTQSTNLIAEVDDNGKRRFIQYLQREGAVVGYIGSSFEEHALMEEVNVGISFSSSSESTKMDSDIVVETGRMGSVFKCVTYGKTLVSIVYRCLTLQLSSNLALIIFTLVGCSPLTNFYYFAEHIVLYHLVLLFLSVLCIPIDEEGQGGLVYSSYKAVLQGILISFSTLIALFRLLSQSESDLGINFAMWTDRNGYHTGEIICSSCFALVFNCIAVKLSKTNKNSKIRFSFLMISFLVGLFLFFGVEIELLKQRALPVKERLVCLAASSIPLVGNLII